jgi:hypothetical protein
MQTRNSDLVIADQVQSMRHQGTKTGNVGPKVLFSCLVLQTRKVYGGSECYVAFLTLLMSSCSRILTRDSSEPSGNLSRVKLELGSA